MTPRRLPSAAVLLTVLTLLRPPAARSKPRGRRRGGPIPLPRPSPQASRTATVADPPATLVYANRAIVELRATVLSRTPAARAGAAAELLHRLARQGQAGRATTRRPTATPSSSPSARSRSS